MSNINRNKVSSIQIQHFRGISKEKEIKFSKNKKYVILWGENGSGKSSFVNAFEFLFRNDLNSLDVPKKERREAIVHKGSESSDLLIRLNFPDKSYFERSLNAFTCSNKGLSRFYRRHSSFLSKASFILNRKKLLSFINVKDGDRYIAIGDLCGLDELENDKNEIKSVKNYYNRHLKEKNQELKSSNKKLNEILGVDLLTYDEYINNINSQLNDLGYDLIDENTDFEEYLSKLDFSESYKIKENINKFNEIYERISISDLDIYFRNILKEYEKLSNESQIRLQYSHNVLDNAKEFLKITKTDTCPVCNSKIDNEGLLLKIDNQLDDINEYISSLNSWKNDISSLISKLNSLKLECDEINIILETLSIEKSVKNSWIISLISELNQLLEFKSSIIDLKDNYDFKSFEIQINSIKEIIDNTSQELNKDVKYDKIKNLRKVINELIQFRKLNEDIENLSSKKDIAEKILDSFNKTKIDYVEEIITNIESDVQRYYEYIHGEDLIKSPKLEMKRDNAIRLFLDSFGEESDPRKFSSEGHLDTLGLCIFLAFMKEYNPLDLIVLDDIITTVDFSHKYQIAKLLVEEFNDFKILLTTHNGLWAQQFKRIVSNYDYNCDDLHIIDWDIFEGPVINENKGHEELIDKYLKAKEYNAAVNTSRQYLEYATLNFCKSNEVKIRLQDEYTLHPLYNAAKPVSIEKAKAIDKANAKNTDENEKLEDKLQYLWDELDNNYFIINNLSHYNDTSFYVYSGEAEHLCLLVRELCPILFKFSKSN